MSAAEDIHNVHTGAAANGASGGVSKVIIDVARADFECQFRAWKHRENKANGADECCDIRVVIARGVTRSMLKELPYKWLVGLTVELTADGVLELLDVEGEEHHNAKVSALMCLDRYASQHESDANGFMACIERPSSFGNETLTPDAMLKGLSYTQADGPPFQLRDQPLVVVEINVYRLNVLQIIDLAWRYLQAPHVQRVVVLKFFDARATGLESDPPLLLKPALAVVFERANKVQPGDIRVVDEVSFGNAPLAGHVLEHLSTVPSRTSPAGQIRSIAASPLEAFTIETRNVYANLREMSLQALSVDVNAAGVTAPLSLDLSEIFKAAVLGWKRDLRC